MNNNTPTPKKEDDHLSTDHLSDDLKGRSVRGGIMTVGRQTASFFLRIGSTAILARLLTPKEFGLVAMVWTFLGFVKMLEDAGLSTATVQKAKLFQSQVSALFWINAGLSLFICLLAASCAPLIAHFYNEPLLINITIVLSFAFLLNGFSIQHRALLRRAMEFKKIVISGVLAQITGIMIGIGCALKGMGYWSLVVMTVVEKTVAVGLVWYLCRWRPSFPDKPHNISGLLKFGGNLTITQLLIYIRRNIDDLLIGVFFGAAQLAFYTKAYSLLLLPIRQINMPLVSVALPALSKLQKDPLKYKQYYIRFIETSTAFSLPVVAFSYVSADLIINIILGPQWSSAIPIFKVLIPAATMAAVNQVSSVVFISLGRTFEQMKAHFVITLCCITGIVIGLKWGTIGVAIGFSCSICICYFPLVLYAYKGSPLQIKDFFSSLWKQSVSSFFSAALILIFRSFNILPDNRLGSLLIMGFLYVLFYVLIIYILPDGKKFLYAFYDTFLSSKKTKLS